MIRILQLPGNLTRDNGRMSVIMNVYRNIDRSKIQFDFAGTGNTNSEFIDNEYVDEIKKLGGKIFLLKKSKIFSARKFMKNLLEQNHYDIVHYHQLSVFGMTFDILKKGGVKKLIVHSHATTMSESKWKKPRNRFFSLPVLCFSDKNIAVSNEAGKNLFLGKKFDFIPNSINQDRYKFDRNARKSIRLELGLEESDVLVGNIGRFSIQKNQEFMIPVMKKLIEKNPKYHFIFIGEGSFNFREEINKNLLTKHVTVLDSTPKVERFYSAFDLFVLPSLFEGLPMVGVEAQGNGLMVLASDKVTSQLKITQTNFLSIDGDKSIDNWVDEISKDTKRINNDIVKNLFLEKGFLIESSVAKWENMYIGLLR